MHYTMYNDELLDKYGIPRRMGALVSKIAALSKKYGEGLWVSNESLAKMINMSTRTVQNWLCTLIDKCVLAIKYVTSAKRYIFFSEKFAKDLNYVIGGGLKGYTVPKQFTKSYALDLDCDLPSNSLKLEEDGKVVEDFCNNCCDSAKYEKNAENRESYFLDLNQVNSKTISDTINLGFLYKEKEKINTQESNTHDITYHSYSFLSYLQKRKRKQLTNYYSKDKLSHNNLDVNCFKQNLYKGKKGDLPTEDNYLSCVCSHNLDSNLLVDHPFNCKKENYTDYMNLHNLEDKFNLSEIEKEKSSAEKEKEAWDHADAVSMERLGSHIDAPGDVKFSSNRLENIINSEKMRKAEEKAKLAANGSERLLTEKDFKLISEIPDEELVNKDLNSQNRWVRAKALADEYFAKRDAEEAEEARKEEARKAEQLEMERREREFKENDPDGFPPVIRAEVNRIIDALHLDKGSKDYQSLICIGKTITRCAIHNSALDLQSMFPDLFRRFYDKIKTNSISNYFLKRGGQDM